MPCMDHVRPDLQSHWNVCSTRGDREASSVIEQCFGRTHLDQKGRKISEIGIKRRNTRVLSSHSCGKICIRQFIQILLMDDWIYGGLGHERKIGRASCRERV